MNRDIVDKIYREQIDYIKEKASLMYNLQDYPEHILTDLFDKDLYQPYYDTFINVLKKDKNSECKHHDIQRYIAKILINYLESLDSTVKVKLRNPMSYPSNFSIIIHDKEVISFSIYDKHFGDFRIDESEGRYQENIKYNQKEIERYKEKIDEYKGYLEHPFKMLKKPKDFWLYYRYKNTIFKNIEKRIKAWNKEIDKIRDSIAWQESKLENYLNIHGKVEEEYQYWRQKFLDWGYKEVGRRSPELYK
jgi:hypothetical protein